MKSKVKNGGAPRKIKAIYKKGFLLFTFDLPNTTNTTKFKMKTLIIIRHAKSSWDNIGQHDRERPLNERGKADAPEMAQRLKEKDLDVDPFVSSPAKRAKRTARYFAEAFGQDKDDVVLVEPLYGADVATFYHIVGNLEDKYDTIAVFFAQSWHYRVCEYTHRRACGQYAYLCPVCGPGRGGKLALLQGKRKKIPVLRLSEESARSV